MAEALANGFEFGVVVSALLFGLRHGIDWDHIAAITDITGSVADRRRAFFYGTLYVLGHAAVVFALGVIAIVLGDRLPESVDATIGRVVGATLILLGIYVFVSLVRHGRDFRMRSRWMLVFAGVRRAARWVRERVGTARGPVSASMPSAGGGEMPAEDASMMHHGHHGRPGHHHHERPEPGHDDLPEYGRATSLGVGMIHGIGAETPTQVLIFLAAAGAGGVGAGVAALVAFVIGLIVSNSAITIASIAGFVSAQRNFGVYATVAVVTGVFSLVVGTIFLFGADSILPAFFAG
ncbi:MAG: hypothetical protein ACRDH6_02775 [Actinomycetota bacterium]